MPENLLLLNRYDFLNENFTGCFSHQSATFDTNFKFDWTLPLIAESWELEILTLLLCIYDSGVLRGSL